MNSRAIRTYIAEFLILATAVGFCAFWLGGSDKISVKNISDEKNNASEKTPSSAFIEQDETKESFASQLYKIVAKSTKTSPAAPTTLTEALADKLATAITEANPDGPNQNNEGNYLAAPDTESVISQYLLSNKIEIETYDWQSQAMAEMSLINIAPENNSSARRKYGEGLTQLLEKQLSVSQPIIENYNQSSAETLQSSASTAIKDAHQIEVPEDLLRMHQALINLLVYERNAINLLNESSVDPIKAGAIMSAREAEYMDALNSFNAEYLRIAFLDGEIDKREESIVAKLIGLKTARAQWIVNDPLAFGQSLWEFVQNTLVETIKDRLVHRMVQQTISYIQGGGSPAFVEDTRQFLIDSADLVAGDFISRYYPNFCESFGPLLRYQLESAYMSNPAPVSCTLSEVVDNVEAFYDSFENGGWIAYGTMIRPENNYYGSFIEVNRKIAQLKESEEEAKKSETESGSGFSPTKLCVEFYYYCEKDETIVGASKSELQGLCPDNSIKRACFKELTTTPGQAIGQTLYDSLGAPLHRIVNADDLSALVSALLNSALNRLVKLVDGKRNNTGVLGISPSSIGTPSGDSYPGCENLSGDALNQCMRNLACASLTGEQKNKCLASWVTAECNPYTTTGNFSGNITVPGGSDSGGGDDSGGGGEYQEQVAGTNDSSNMGGTLSYSGVRCILNTSGGSTTNPAECAGENCNGGSPGPCNCRCRDGLTDSNFCFLNPLLSAKDEVVGDWLGNPGIDVGLSSTGCDGGVCVVDKAKFASALGVKLSDEGLTVSLAGDEFEVRGACATGISTCGLAGCITSPRSENIALVSSGNTIRSVNIARAVCNME